MSTEIILKNHRAYKKEWVSEKKKYVETGIDSRDIVDYLWTPVSIGNNFRVMDLLGILSVPEYFHFWTRALGEPFFESVLDEHFEFTNGDTKKRPKETFDKVIVKYSGQSNLHDNVKIDLDRTEDGHLKFNYKVPKTIKTHKEFELVLDVHGKVKGSKDAWALDLAPLAAYDKAQLVIENNFSLWEVDYTYQNRKKKKRLDSAEKVLGTTTITLLQLIKALIYEFTFCGGREDRDKKREEIKGMVETYKKAKNAKKVIIEE